jgi:hypothetical protein
MRKQLFFIMLVALGLAGCGKGTESTTPPAEQTAMTGDANYPAAEGQSAVQPGNDMGINTAPTSAPVTGNETTNSVDTTVNGTTSDNTGNSTDTNIDEN